MKAGNPLCTIILFTVPIFDFVGEQEAIWREVNENILNHPPQKADRIFNIAKVLSQPKPMDNLSKYGSRRNDDGGSAVAGAFVQHGMSINNIFVIISHMYSYPP